jgi:hypothetical protein
MRKTVVGCLSIAALVGCSSPDLSRSSEIVISPSDSSADNRRAPTSLTRFLPGLGVEAEYVTQFEPGSAPRKFVRLDGGEPLAPYVVRALERAARRERFGAAETHLGLELERAADTELIPLAVAMTVPDWEQLSPQARRDQLAPFSEALSTMGIRNPQASPRMPIVYGVASAGAARRIARAPGVTAV